MGDNESLKQFAADARMKPEEVVDSVFERTAKEISGLVRQLSAKEKVEGRRERERELKQLTNRAYHQLSKLPQKYLRRTHGAFAAAHMFDYHSSRGVVLAGEPDNALVLKIKESRGSLRDEDAHLIDIADSQLFADDEKFRMAPIYDPFQLEGRYVMVPDEQGKEKPTLVQYQKYINGSTPGEIIPLLIPLIRAGKLTNEEKQAVVETFIDKPIKDTFYWWTKNLKTKFKKGNELPLNIKEIKNRKVERLAAAINRMQELRGAEFDKEELSYVQNNYNMLCSLIPDDGVYGRGRNPTAFNFVLAHPLGELTKDNIMQLFEQDEKNQFKYMKPENMYNIDTEASSGYKEINDDLADYTEALEFDQLGLLVNPPISGKGSSSALRDYQKKRFGYTGGAFSREVNLFFRTMRLPDYTVARYLRRTVESKGNHPDYHLMLGRYVAEVPHFAGRARNHLRNIITAKEKEGTEEPRNIAKSLKPLEKIVEKYSRADMNAVIRNYEKNKRK